MALATITGNRSDIAGLPDRGDLWFKPTVPTEDALSPRRVKATIAEDGDFTIQLHPGVAAVTIFNADVPFVVPGDGGIHTLWSLIQAALELPPDTPQSKLNIAVANYIEGSSDILTKPVADTTYAPLTAVAQTNTWDPTTGSIATITEHYPAPIGDRVTTYGGYNAVGDPTTEIDPDGVHWVLGYDSAGNQTTRTVAP